MTVTVVIPSYRRPQMLSRCLQHVFAQRRQPEEIIVCIRDDDDETKREIASHPSNLLTVAHTSEPGVIAAMNAGIAASSGDIVALLDDDAFPRQDWLERIVAAFERNTSLLGVGGIDLQQNPDHKNPRNRFLPVGTISWYGRLHGSHHLGTGPARRVNVLKGCNCAYRGEFLRRVGIDPFLRGAGAQVGWEIALGFDAMREGGVLLYDPAIVVDHLIAPRLDGDSIHRGRYNANAAYDIAWNFYSILRRKAPPGLRIRLVIWEFAVGSLANPGILRVADRRTGALRERLRRILGNFRAFRDSRSTGTAHAAAAPVNIAGTISQNG